jgi:transposase
MTCCQEKGLPFFYTLFPGSIVDVSTIKNQLSYLVFERKLLQQTVYQHYSVNKW